ncbi:MAG: metallophosphoesterase [Verrucomicrobiaceae bacterium]|nr:metallophosphoesterase [Verrucomicrobiaceae bacterium]
MKSASFTRRRALKTVFCSSAYLALNLGTRAAEKVEAAGLNFMMIGDFGNGEPSQFAVAKGMAKYVQDNRLTPDALLLLGDNFYKKMEGGVKSERWKVGFEDMYPASVFPGPCPAILGNHDYHDNAGGEKTQLAYAAKDGTRWYMPAKWYRRDFSVGGVSVTMLFLDTNLRSVSGSKDAKTGKTKASLTEAEEKEQWAWLKAELGKSRGNYTFVLGHHPVYSNGLHGDSKELVKTLAPLLQESGVHLYLCGHDHDLQHLELEGQRTSFVLSGGGGARVRALDKPTHKDQPYGKDIYGFSHIQVSAARCLVTHYDANRAVLHQFEKRPDFSWKALA